MKKFMLLLALVTGAASAQVTLVDFNRNIGDIAGSGYNRDTLYQSMNTDLVKTNSSICSNRALLWNYDFARFQRVDSAKMFLFYTGKTGEVGRKTWWYHVTPIVNENGKLWTLDAGFPGFIDEPLTIPDWFQKFVGSADCKEIRANETDLIELMTSGRVFPEYTRYGRYSCYYIITPKEFWTPATVAEGLLNREDRTRFNSAELNQACVEAATGGLGRILGGAKKKCENYLRFGRY
jgi:hypothetical protein